MLAFVKILKKFDKVPPNASLLIALPESRGELLF